MGEIPPHGTGRETKAKRYMKPTMRRFVLLLTCLVLLLSFGSVSFAEEVNPQQVFRKASNLMATGDYESAIEILDTIPEPASADDAADYVRSRIQRAQLFFALEMTDEAEAAANKVLAIFPEHVEAKNLLTSLANTKKSKFALFLEDVKLFMPPLIQGAGMTLFLVVITMVISPVGGLLIALGRISGVPPIRWLCWFIIWFFRGTPLLLQLFFIYYGMPALGVTLSPTTSAVIGLGVNYSAYLAEIIRAGIESIDDGQMEAAKIGRAHV